MKPATEQQSEARSGSLERLVSELKAQCNRHINGSCQTLSCLKRGGYQRGDKPNYKTATCERHEQIKALEAMLANAKERDAEKEAYE